MPSALILVIAPDFNVNINNQDDFVELERLESRIVNRLRLNRLRSNRLQLNRLRSNRLQACPNRLQSIAYGRIAYGVTLIGYATVSFSATVLNRF